MLWEITPSLAEIFTCYQVLRVSLVIVIQFLKPLKGKGESFNLVSCN